MARNNFTFQSNLNNHFDSMKNALKKGLIVATLTAEDNAVQLAPIDTGRLKGDIKHDIDEENLVGIVGNTVEYAPHLEFGTSKQSAQPYIRPGLQDKNVREAFEKELEEEMDG